MNFPQIMGLENSKVFTLLMIMGAFSITGLLAVVTHVRGNMEVWHHHRDEKLPSGISSVRFITNSKLPVINIFLSLSTTTLPLHHSFRFYRSLLYSSCRFQIIWPPAFVIRKQRQLYYSAVFYFLFY
jgi:hypothetical protein